MLTFQFQVVEGGGEVLVEVFKVLAQDWIQLCFVEQIQQRTAEQIVAIPVLHGAPPDFHQDPPSSAGSSGLLDLASQGVLGTFLRGEIRVPVWVRTLGRNCMRSRAHPRGELMAGWSLWWEELDLGPWVDEFGRCWTRSLACPSRWFLQDTSELVWWDEPDEPG